MPRLSRSLLLPLSFLLLACGESGARRTTFEGAPIILISIDTLRADRLPAWGYDGVETPAIDRLARDGVVFENAYAHVPLTLPSHVTMLTGKLPYETGVRSNIGYRFTGDPKTTLPALLAGRGYATGGAVSAYVLRGETGLGGMFDAYDDSVEVSSSATLGALQRDGNETLASALRWMDRLGEKPFFLFLHLFEPHTPYQPAEPFKSRYRDAYDGEIATVDAIVGAFLGELERRGLYDDALIVLVSDHGEGLGDHGEKEHGVLLYREALHVPLVVKLPGGARRGERVAAPAQIVDLLPTLARAAGAAVPDGLPGTSLLELGAPGAPPRAVYGETLYPRLHLGWSELRSLIDARHHYIESPAPELFDIVGDPRETANVREERRREAHALARALSATPLNLTAPGAADPEEMARLAALGYLSGPSADSAAGPRRNPRDHIAVLSRVQEAFRLHAEGKVRESIELCRAILADYPDLVDVYNQLAAALRTTGRPDLALEAYREAIRRSPQLVDSIAVEIAKLELDLGNLEAAELNARQAMKLNPAEAHLLLAGVASRRKQWEVAEREARLALGDEKRPRLAALVLLAKILVERQRLDEALAVADRAAQRIRQDGAPPVATLAATRGDILARMGRSREAEAAFRTEIRNFPRTTEAYTRLAVLLASEHRFAEIEPTLDAMVKASPAPATHELAARVMTDLGNAAGAAEYRRRGRQAAAAMQARRQ